MYRLSLTGRIVMATIKLLLSTEGCANLIVYGVFFFITEHLVITISLCEKRCTKGIQCDIGMLLF